MSKQPPATIARQTKPALTPVSHGVLQRACACGQHSTAGEECESCRKQREGRIQRAVAPGVSAPPPAPNPGAGLDLSRIPLSQPSDPAEREAESVAQQVVQALNGNPLGSPAALRLRPVVPLVQRQVATESAPTAPTPETTPQTTSASLLVEDDAESIGPGQLRKREFLAQLRAEVCAASDAALARVGRSTEGCPYLDRWFAYYEQQSSAHVERAIRRYAPETASASSARDYIPPVVARVRQGVERWASTGEISGVPEELMSTMGGLGGLGARVAGAFGGALGGLVRGIGSLFFMAQPGGPRPADPQTVQARLGAGQPLESATRTRMERAFGADFGTVRVHRDANAASLARNLNARAFTLGNNVAFAAGEYQPGTILGDALLAHELAHVVQQGGAAAQVAPLEAGSSGSHALEHDADRAAGGVLAQLWGGAQGAAADLARNAVPRLRSGLRLQRCASNLPPLRDPQQVLGESQTAEQHMLTDIQQSGRRLAQETRDPTQAQILAEAEVSAEVDIRNAIGWLRQIYQDELADAGEDTTRQRQAQQRFEEQMQRLRESYRLQFELSRRYGVNFTTGRLRTEFQRMPPRERWRVTVWSREELETVDRILRSVPPEYMSNFRSRARRIQREPSDPHDSNAAAAWDERNATLLIYNLGFENPERISQYILHEIGHSTVQERTVGGFPHLPPADWMALSDWQTSTRASLGADLGLSGSALREALDRLDRNAQITVGVPRPIQIGNRMVIHDKYETTFSTPSRFFHYAVAHNEEFVSNYARSHPAEDLAESFAFSMLRPDETRRVLDVGARGVRDKWDYLTQHYPQRLRQQ